MADPFGIGFDLIELPGDDYEAVDRNSSSLDKDIQPGAATRFQDMASLLVFLVFLLACG